MICSPGLIRSMKRKHLLDREIDEEILQRMPPWFRKLREAYLRLRDRR